MDELEAKAMGAKIYSQKKTLPMTDEFHNATWKEQEWMIEGWIEAQDKYFMEKRSKGHNPSSSDEDTIEHHMTVWLLLHSIPSAHGSPGVVVDADVAARTPCTAYGKIWFSKGIIGALSEAQKAAYCPTVEHKRSPGIERRLAQWHEAVGVCKKDIAAVPKGERLEPWLSCMGRELPKHGIEI